MSFIALNFSSPFITGLYLFYSFDTDLNFNFSSATFQHINLSWNGQPRQTRVQLGIKLNGNSKNKLTSWIFWEISGSPTEWVHLCFFTFVLHPRLFAYLYVKTYSHVPDCKSPIKEGEGGNILLIHKVGVVIKYTRWIFLKTP